MANIKPRSRPRPGRVKGDDMTDLREQAWERDSPIGCGGGIVYRGKKVGCGFPMNPNNWQLAHLQGKRRGGDNLTNVAAVHPTCHMVWMHNPKSVPRKGL